MRELKLYEMELISGSGSSDEDHLARGALIGGVIGGARFGVGGAVIGALIGMGIADLLDGNDYCNDGGNY